MKGRSRERKGRGLRGTLSPFGSLVALIESVWKENIVTTLQLLNTETDAFTLLLFPLPPNLGEKKKRKKKKKMGCSGRESFYTPSLSTQPSKGNLLSFFLHPPFFFPLWFSLLLNIMKAKNMAYVYSKWMVSWIWVDLGKIKESFTMVHENFF